VEKLRATSSPELGLVEEKVWMPDAAPPYVRDGGGAAEGQENKESHPHPMFKTGTVFLMEFNRRARLGIIPSAN
jgi:hypothetical protein